MFYFEICSTRMAESTLINAFLMVLETFIQESFFKKLSLNIVIQTCNGFYNNVFSPYDVTFFWNSSEWVPVAL